MSNKLFRRLTFSTSSRDDGSQPCIRTENGESASKLVKTLLKTLEAYMGSKTPEKLAEIGGKVHAVWMSVFDINKATAPQKKYELAEELLLRPDVLKLLLFAFRLVHLDVKRKIRDIFLLVITWCSNESSESCVPRTRAKSKFQPKVRDQLFHCRLEVIDIVAEGYDDVSSCALYNDIVREFVKDELCLLALLEDEGRDSTGFAVRAHGCVWSVFERLTLTDGKTYFDPFDVTYAAFDTLQIIFGTNHEAVFHFIHTNYTRFCRTVQKLISSANFFVQSKSLRFLYEILTTERHVTICEKWLQEPQLMKTVILAMQSNKKTVRAEAIGIFELFLANPSNSEEIVKFIRVNRRQLVTYCLESAPVHYYTGDRIEQEDARFARIAHILLSWNVERPMTRKKAEEYEEVEKLQQKYFEEQTIQTRHQDFVEGAPKTRHEYKMPLPCFPPPISEPMMFGNPMGCKISQ